jgi:hypothetical protein
MASGFVQCPLKLEVSSDNYPGELIVNKMVAIEVIFDILWL